MGLISDNEFCNHTVQILKNYEEFTKQQVKKQPKSNTRPIKSARNEPIYLSI